MPPFETIAAILAAYIAVAVLLLSLNILSRWRWWVKGSAMAATGLLFIVSYFAMNSLLGLPSRDRVPERFSLVASRVVEPNRQLGEQGAIYLWIELLDDDNIPSGEPLNYRVDYTDALANAVNKAQDLIDQGGAVEATLREVGDDTVEIGDVETMRAPQSGDDSGGGQGEHIEGVMLVFNNMPPVRLPGKGPL